MSATNRGAQRAPDDYYATPAWTIDALLKHVLPDGTSRPQYWYIDPGCGDGAIIERLIVTAHVEPGSIIGVEAVEARSKLARERFSGCSILDSDYLDSEVMGYMARRRNGAFMIIGNPPYSHAIEFAERSLAIAGTRPGSIVCFLLRLAFLETIKRAEFHRAHPSHVFVLPRRPSFCHSFKCTGNAGARHEEVKLSKPTTTARLACSTCGINMKKTTSDATAYGWFVWGDGKPGTWEIL